MSIVAYTGLPGAGKSYGVVENVIVPALAEGREVYTNIPLNQDQLGKRFPDCRATVFDVSAMRDDPAWCLDTVPAGVVFVLDEVWRVWPAGLKANNVDESYKSFLAEHRHYVSADGFSTQIVLVTQDLSQVAAFARDLVEQTVVCKKLDGVGASKRYRVDIYDGAIKGQRGPKDRVLNKQFGKYKPEIYSLYQSHTQSDSGVAGFEGKTDKRGTVFKSGIIKFGVPLAVLLAAFGIYNAWHFFHPEPDQTTLASDVETLTPTVPAVATVEPPQVPAPSLPQFSDEWRLGGHIDGFDTAYALIVNTSGRTRVIGMQNCDHFADTGMLYCTIDGAYVTRWTGSAASPVSPVLANAS